MAKIKFIDYNVNVIDWPSQNPDQPPTSIAKERKKVKDLGTLAKEKQTRIPIKTCQNLETRHEKIYWGTISLPTTSVRIILEMNFYSYYKCNVKSIPGFLKELTGLSFFTNWLRPCLHH